MTKHIDVSDEAEPLPKGYGFPHLEPAAHLDPDAAVFDAGAISRMDRPLVGMAIKPRDPAVDLMVKVFLSRHSLRLVGFFPKLRPSGRPVCGGSAEHGITMVAPRETKTKEGDRWVTPSEEAYLRHYKPVPGDATYKAQQTILAEAGVYEDRFSAQSGWMSLGETKHSRLSWDSTIKAYRQAVPKSQKLPEEGKLPERHCLNPECLLPIEEEQHHNKQYCNAKCTARAKELRRLDRKNRKASGPIHYRNELSHTPDLTNNINQLETGVPGPHISRGIFSKDRPAEVAVYQQ